MADALADVASGPRVAAASAGGRWTRVLRRRRERPLTARIAITLCGDAEETCPVTPPQVQRMY